MYFVNYVFQILRVIKQKIDNIKKQSISLVSVNFFTSELDVKSAT